ncbi:TniQ family protein [Paenibacillus sp. LjRoot56]|uniref:TniQ family protein n=1 Tax=Paenibacillus sp. LjRoot56 TaxID=3342333 RepID=UPI003ECF3CE0
MKKKISNNSPKRLPIRPRPRDDESLVSYIYRLANANYYDISCIYELLGIDITKIRTRGFQLGNEKIDTAILSKITGIDQNVFDRLTLNIKNSNSVIQNTIDQILRIPIRSALKITRENNVKRGHSYYIKKDFIEKLEELINHKSKVINDESSLIVLYQSQNYFIRITKGTLIDYYKFLFESGIQLYIKPGKLGLNKIFFDKQQLAQKLESYVYLEKADTSLFT